LFIPRFKNNEIRQMLLSFAAREGIHQRAYALLNDTLGLPESEYSAFLEYKEMADKVEFMQDNDTGTMTGIARALAQSACNEGMSLFSAFIMLLNYQRMGKMRGMCEVVLWSIRDESEHCKGMTRLFRSFLDEHPRIVTDEFKRGIYDMFRNAVELEDKFIDLAHSMGEHVNLPADTVKEYIRYIADRRLSQLGLKPNWNIERNPCEWFDWLVTGESHGNFFEGRVTDYSAEGLTGGDWGYGHA
jgi:ribonucleoside-diphosphate reductase beta chain